MASHRSLNVRETIDLNKDDSLTRFEMLAGISRLVRPSFWQWHDTHIKTYRCSRLIFWLAGWEYDTEPAANESQPTHAGLSVYMVCFKISFNIYGSKLK